MTDRKMLADEIESKLPRENYYVTSETKDYRSKAGGAEIGLSLREWRMIIVALRANALEVPIKEK